MRGYPPASLSKPPSSSLKAYQKLIKWIDGFSLAGRELDDTFSRHCSRLTSGTPIFTAISCINDENDTAFGWIRWRYWWDEERISTNATAATSIGIHEMRYSLSILSLPT